VQKKPRKYLVCTLYFITNKIYLAQSWWRKIQQLGLSKAYKSSNNDISDYLKCVFGLPFLNPEEVFDCFIDDLMTIKPVNTIVINFVIIFQKHTYSKMHYFHLIFGPSLQQPQIAPQIVVKVIMQKLNVSIIAAHPNIFVLIEILLGIQSEIYVSLRSSATQPIKKTAGKRKIFKKKDAFFYYWRIDSVKFCKRRVI